MEIKAERHVGYNDAARITGLCLATLYTKVSRGEIPHYRLGRRLVVFSVAELARWMADRHVTANPKKARDGGAGPHGPAARSAPGVGGA